MLFRSRLFTVVDARYLIQIIDYSQFLSLFNQLATLPSWYKCTWQHSLTDWRDGWLFRRSHAFISFFFCYSFCWNVACVAGGISCASAFVLVAKPWTRVAIPWEDWWRVELNSRLPKFVGFFELCVYQCTRISDWLRALKHQSNVNLYLSSACFHTQICKWRMRRNA